MNWSEAEIGEAKANHNYTGSLRLTNINYICICIFDMAKISQRIDRLTNSIVNMASGDSFETDVILLQASELKKLKKGWKFD